MQDKTNRRRVWTVLTVASVLLAGAGMAVAADGGPGDDTQLNLAYDSDNHILVVGTSANDSPWDCTLANGTLAAEYGAATDRQVPVDMLSDDDGPVEFINRPADDVGDEFAPAEGPVAYEGSDGTCGVSGALVGGDAGQVNHGQVMKAFHQLVDMPGMGCVNRIVAQSDLGKWDQQVKASDVEELFVPDSSGEVQFITETADCEHGNKNKHEDANGPAANSNSHTDNDKGRPESPGNSGNAPGHNK